MVQQRGHFYAIVDEVDNILIDEARTPLIISGPVDRSTHRYDEIKPIVFELVKKQNELVNRIMARPRSCSRRGRARATQAIRLLQAQKGLPKHKRLIKLKSRAGVQAAIEKVELEFLPRRRCAELDEELYYVVDESGHQIDLTEKGREALCARPTPSCGSCPTSWRRSPPSRPATSRCWSCADGIKVLRDRQDARACGRTQGGRLGDHAPRRRRSASPTPRWSASSPARRWTRRSARPPRSTSAPTTACRRRSCTTSRSCCAHTRSTRRTWSTWCRRTRSSSSTSSPAA